MGGRKGGEGKRKKEREIKERVCGEELTWEGKKGDVPAQEHTVIASEIEALSREDPEPQESKEKKKGKILCTRALECAGESFRGEKEGNREGTKGKKKVEGKTKKGADRVKWIATSALIPTTLGRKERNQVGKGGLEGRKGVPLKGKAEKKKGSKREM